MSRYKTILDVIKVKSVENGDCLEWTGYYNANGTPTTGMNGIPTTVRRLAAIRLGMDVTDKVVMMTCRDKRCVNPKHIELMSRSQACKITGALSLSSMDMRIKNKIRNHNRAKLTSDQVAVIRDSAKTQRVLAKEYGVDQAIIGRIKRGTYIGRQPEMATSPFTQMLVALA